jgi:predicted exporter
LLLVVGVGSNYTLFFEREMFGRTDPQRTIVSFALWNASTVIGFGLLSLARAPCSAPSERRSAGRISPLLFATILAGRARA